MSLTNHGMIMQIWRDFPTIYGLLDKASDELESPLDDYGVSKYSDDVINGIKRSLIHMECLLPLYAGIVGNKKRLQSSDLILTAPKIEMELEFIISRNKEFAKQLLEQIREVEEELIKIRSDLAPRGFFRFKSEDVSNLGPFNEGQSLNFKNPFTLVIGDNGTGKTTIVNKLKSNFPDYSIHPSGLYNLSFLIFFTQEDIMSRSYNTSELLLAYGIEKEDFDISVNELLEDLFPNHKWYSRFFDKNYPKATGEVIIMNLVINFAIRKVLRLDYPIVLEDWSGFLDTNYFNLFISILRKNCSQVILMSHPGSIYQQIGLNPDYYLNIDSKTNKSNILIADRDT